jgi:hypothetical protein
MKTNQTSFAMDESTQKALDELKSFFGVRTNSAVIKRALAIAQVARENSDKNKHLTIRDTAGAEKVVLLAS